MQINREYEQEIDLKDLFFDVLYHWRSILIAALVGAVLLGAYQHFSIARTHSQGKQTKEEKQYEIDLQNYNDSMETARLNIRTYNKLIKEQNDYLKESVYMTLDSQEEWVARRNYFVKLDQAVLESIPEGVKEDPADYVAAVYVNTLKNGLDAAEMQTLMGTGRKDYIDELVTISADYATNTLTVQVIGADEETVKKQLAYFSDRLQTACSPLAQEIAPHTLALVNEDANVRTDSNLSTKQDEINQKLVEWQEALKEQRETLNELEEKEEPTPPGTHVKKFAAIGFIAGAFLLACFYAVRYVMGGRLHIASELSEAYVIPLYGEYAKSRARRPGKGLDKLFEKWEFGHRDVNPDTLTDHIASLIGERYGGKRVMLTGTLSGEKLDGLRKSLESRLGGDVRLEAKGDFLTSGDAVSAIGGSDAVILVEEKHVSKNRDIAREAELLMIGKSDVGGCIVI